MQLPGMVASYVELEILKRGIFHFVCTILLPTGHQKCFHLNLYKIFLELLALNFISEPAGFIETLNYSSLVSEFPFKTRQKASVSWYINMFSWLQYKNLIWSCLTCTVIGSCAIHHYSMSHAKFPPQVCIKKTRKKVHHCCFLADQVSLYEFILL